MNSTTKYAISAVAKTKPEKETSGSRLTSCVFCWDDQNQRFKIPQPIVNQSDQCILT